jgi:hypothetical protein
MLKKMKKQLCSNGSNELNRSAIAEIDLKQSVVPDVVIPLGNGREIRLIPVDSIRFRRRNYRRMDARTWQALDRSFEKFGLFSAIIVCKGSGGDYYMVDGHHRLEMAKKKGYKWIPAFVFPEDVDLRDLDLAMLAFNITAEVDPDPYVELISDLAKDEAVVDDLSLFTGMDFDTIKKLTEEYDYETNEDNLDATAVTTEGKVKGRHIQRFLMVPLPKPVAEKVQQLMDALGIETPTELVNTAIEHIFREVIGTDNNDSET